MIHNKYFKPLKMLRHDCLLVIVLSLGFVTTLKAQDNSEYLRRVIVESQQQFSQNDPYTSAEALGGLDAWVDDSELRWKAGDFSDFERQQLSYKVSFKNSQQVDAERDILQLGSQQRDINATVLLENRLRQRYTHLIELAEQQMRQSVLQQQRHLVDTELSVWKSKVLTDGFRADKLQDADLNLDTVWSDELENQAGLRRYQQDTGAENVAQHLISIPGMIDITQDILESRVFEQTNPDIRKADLALRIAKKEQQRTDAEANLAFKSVKILYDNKDDAFGAELGVNIPLTRNSFQSTRKRQSAYYSGMDAENERMRITEQLEQKQFVLFRLHDDWQRNQRLLQKISARIERVVSVGDPQLVMDLKDRQLSLVQRQNQIRIRALKQFVSFLHNAGMLSATPYRNWIQSGTPRILLTRQQ